MSFGVYRDANGWLGRFDARAKIAAVLLFLAAAVAASSWAALGTVTAAAALLWRGSGQGVSRIAGQVRPFLPLLAFIALMNGAAGVMAAAQGAPAAALALQGLSDAAFAALKLVDALLGAAVLSVCTSPVQLTAAFRWFLSPLRRVGVPVDEAGLSLSLVVRFAPLLADQAERVRRAQMSRGASFDGPGLVARLRQWAPVVTPLIVGAFRRCDTMAYAVASRGFFSPCIHTSLAEFRWTSRDTLLVAGASCLFTAVAFATLG